MQQMQHHCTSVHFKIQFFQTLIKGQRELTWRNVNSINRNEYQLNSIFINRILFLQVSPSYPGTHPWVQLPVIWWHAVLFQHFPQVKLQFSPWNPTMHSIEKKHQLCWEKLFLSLNMNVQLNHLSYLSMIP